MARLRRRFAPLSLLLVAGLALAACGTGGALSGARAACKQVNSALVYQHRSAAPGLSSAERQVLEGQAMSTLLAASSAAAQATSADGSWNVLQTTIQEAERVPLAPLVPALTRICQVANSATPYL